MLRAVTAGGSAAIAALALLCAVAAPASAVRDAEINLRPPAGMRSRSMDFAWEGGLRRGMRLAQSQYVHHVGEYTDKGNFYGTWELVQLLERAARRVAFRIPGARLAVGELSAPKGGRIAGHRSHQSGRDVDIGFYMTTADGQPYHGWAFAEFNGRGVGTGPNAMLRFDDARNWELVKKLVSDAEARVQYIFVGRKLRQRLLSYARATGAPPRTIERAAAVMTQPAVGHPHRNHFHVRIYCPPADRPRCRDQAPYWPWYPGEPPGQRYLLPSRHVLGD